MSKELTVWFQLPFVSILQGDVLGMFVSRPSATAAFQGEQCALHANVGERFNSFQTRLLKA